MRIVQACFLLVVLMRPFMASGQETNFDGQAITPSSITFETFDKAVEKSGDQQKPIVIVFSAKWCSWCRKLDAGPMRSPEVLAVAPNYIWAKTDIDAEPFLAAVFQVRSVPAIRVINGRGETLDARSGYMTAYQLKELLETYKDGFNAVGTQEANILQSTKLHDRLRDYKHGESDKTVFSEAVVWLSKPHPPMKRAITKALLSHKEKTWSTLLEDMASANLAVRAAASELLKQSSELTFKYDPFADESNRKAQLEIITRQVNVLLEEKFYPNMR